MANNYTILLSIYYYDKIVVLKYKLIKLTLFIIIGNTTLTISKIHFKCNN